MPIPPLSFEATVSPDGAKHDKIHIGIEDGLVLGDREDVWNFLNHLGAPPRNERNNSDVDPYGLFFSRFRDSERRFNRQTVRNIPFEAGRRIYRPPLFSGWLEVEQMEGVEETWRIDMCLSLNPTRFVRHQPMPPRLSLFHPQSVFPHFETNIFRREIGEPNDEQAFMRCDNWIPNTRSWQRFASEAFWPNHLRNCLTRLPQEAIQDLHRTARLSSATCLSGQVRYNLHSVETYWEFLCDDPLGTVLRLETMLETYCAQPATDSEASEEPDEERQYSRVLRRVTRTGETLKIYAKTNRRIRFEVVHRLRGSNGFRVPRGGHTFPTTEGIFPLLTHLTTVAAERVNDVLRHFRLHASVPDRQHTVLKFLADFQAACRNPDRALQLLQILTCHGWIDVGQGIAVGRIYSNELRRLQGEILQRSNHRYSVTPPYRQALENMRRTGIGFLLGTRIRRKQSF